LGVANERGSDEHGSIGCMINKYQTANIWLTLDQKDSAGYEIVLLS
jgi:hypothetical protein